MANDPILGMLGLARRAGKLAAGDDMVKELCTAGKARAVFVANDAGASAAKKAAGYAERARVPFITLPQDKDTLGAAIGRAQSAVCAVSDIGMAAATVAKLAAADSRYAEAAEQLLSKNTRIQFRKGKKKKSALSGADKPNKQKITTEVSANGN
ncbi:L7Ae/L30e/S12e/Gadd45 family ribosomal protein [Agathobaculum sp.]|uniref:L7Ae/L30e/S12e/Gadd45 family ribosomal protein n=1 Tax=Agathobaculum sp. TaxID=2048138 RepID=UPI002A8360C0|nr:ribosomal L7Ae/L30e/S12e/Gadd45 family protein [Agathobaculum sp.]MDY3618143.1 ribosomal L7Ae/L30e/S12e/Gadd45 family protein [Agathobaculum sp.]